MKRKAGSMMQEADVSGAQLHVRHSLNGCSSLIRSYSTYPIKFVQHGRNDTPACLVYVLGFGGGVVSRDQAHMRWVVGQHSTLYVKTQGVTKIYKNKIDEKSVVKLHVTIEDGATLFNIPEHTSLYKDAHLQLKQSYDILGNGSLIAVDWFSSGRTESDTVIEHWNLHRLHSNVSITLDGETVYSEELNLYSDDAVGTVQQKVGGAVIFGSILLFGPSTSAIREKVSELNQRQSFEDRKIEIMKNCSSSMNISGGSSTFFSKQALVSASALTHKMSIVRFAAGRIEDAYGIVNSILKFDSNSKYYIGQK